MYDEHGEPLPPTPWEVSDRRRDRALWILLAAACLALMINWASTTSRPGPTEEEEREGMGGLGVPFLSFPATP